MSNKLYEETYIQDIANAIRSKGGSSDTFMVSEMAQAILDIPIGGGFDCDYGTITPSMIETTHTFTTTKERKHIAVWANSIVSTSNALDWIYGNYVYGTRQGAHGYTNNAIVTTTAGISSQSSFDALSIKIGAGNALHTFASGVTYNWLAW